jgi:tetratricopeptide (TPR) repeat protein
MRAKTNKFLRFKHKNITRPILALAIGQLVLLFSADAVGRHLEVGQKIPEFSATDIAGQPFDYKHGCRKAKMVAFLSTTKKRSVEATEDISRIVAKFGAKAENLDVVIVVYDPNSQSCLQPVDGQLKAGYRVLPDKEYSLFGKFGIIALPTVIISDTNDTVLCVKAGYAYDFSLVVRAHLDQALGITRDILSEDALKVKTANMDSNAARAVRHLQMAKMLKKKGQLDSAIDQAQKAHQFDPNCIEAALELGELYCQSGQSSIAIEVVGQVEGSNRLQKARVSLLLGWAKHQMNQLDAAEELLLESTTLNPRSSRGFWELGKIYQARGQTDKAMISYRMALANIFGEPKVTKSHALRHEQKTNVSMCAEPQ